MSKKKLKKLLIYIPVLIEAAFFFIPLLWMISTSLKGSEEIFISPPRWIPKNIKWKNYKDAFEAIPYVKYILNTVKTTGLAVLGNVISAPMIGYAFGKLKWPGRDKVFLLVIATMMLPFSVTMIPLYSMSSKFGWINTYIPLVLPDFLGRSYFIFLMRQFFTGVPDELLDAGRIDGLSEFGVYTRIALPLVTPALSALGIFTFLGNWNSFLWPVIALDSKEKYTITLGLAQFSAENASQWELIMTGASIIIIFLIFQKKIIEGVQLTGVKG